MPLITNLFFLYMTGGEVNGVSNLNVSGAYVSPDDLRVCGVCGLEAEELARVEDEDARRFFIALLFSSATQHIRMLLKMHLA